MLRKSSAVLVMTQEVSEAAVTMTTGVREPGRTRWNRPSVGAELRVAEVAPNLRPPDLSMVSWVTWYMLI